MAAVNVAKRQRPFRREGGKRRGWLARVLVLAKLPGTVILFGRPQAEPASALAGRAFIVFVAFFAAEGVGELVDRVGDDRLGGLVQ